MSTQRPPRTRSRRQRPAAARRGPHREHAEHRLSLLQRSLSERSCSRWRCRCPG